MNARHSDTVRRARPSRILIVDPDDRNRELLTIMLGREGFDLFTARSGEEALTTIAADPPDLILLDARLPGMPGDQVAAILKGDVATRNIPIVMLTSLDTLEDRIRGLKAGAEDVLSRPVDRTELCTRVKNLLGLKAYGDHFYQYSRRLEGEVASRTAALVERTKALEERSRDLARALDRAEKAGRAKEALLGRVSHELRTPLNAIVGWADVIEKDHSPALLRRALPAIKRNGLAQERVIENLLDASSIDAGLLRLDAQAADLRIIVASAIDIVRPAAEARTLSILSTCEGPVMVLGDPARLRQVVWHLLSNAVKFTPEGGAVCVHLRCAGRTVRLEVSDDGIGMAPEYLPQAFSGFSQADMSSTRQYTGLGLGLTIVRRLVEMQGGTVTAFSAGDNQGATFVVELPAYDPQSCGHCTTGIPVVPARREMGPLTGVRVLVVDDNPESRQTIATILEAAGAVTAIAESGPTGLQCLLDLETDVVVSDVEMPHRDGIPFIQDVRALPDYRKRCVPVVALTPLAGTRERQTILAAGFQSAVAKPVSADALVPTIASACGRALGPASSSPSS